MPTFGERDVEDQAVVDGGGEPGVFANFRFELARLPAGIAERHHRLGGAFAGGHGDEYVP